MLEPVAVLIGPGYNTSQQTRARLQSVLPQVDDEPAAAGVCAPPETGAFALGFLAAGVAPFDTWASPLQCSGREMQSPSMCGPSLGRLVGPCCDVVANS